MAPQVGTAQRSQSHADLAECRLRYNIKTSDLRDSEEERGEPERFKFLCQDIGDTATQELTCQPILSRYYASMMQDGLQIAGPLGGGGVAPPHTHPHPHPNLSDWPVG